MTEIENILNSIYYDIKNPSSFSNANVLLKSAKNIYKSITKKHVNDWLKAQFVHTLHKEARRKFKRNRIIVQDIDEVFEADLVDMQEFSSDNDNFKYILTVIDVMSKFAFAIPLKNKTSKEIIIAFEKVFKKRKPLCLRTDQGKEFLNNDFKKFLKKYQVYHYTSKNKDIKCAIVERFNRTFKMKMFKYFTSKGKRRYIDVLEDLVNNYNNSFHRTIKMTPNEASYKEREILFKTIYGNLNLTKSKQFQVGEKVRKAYERKPFDKSYYPNWTDEIFEISKKSKDNIPLYKIHDDKNRMSKNRFYKEQIQNIIPDTYRVEKVIRKRIYKGKKQCLVKWLNYNDEYNSWVDENEIIIL